MFSICIFGCSTPLPPEHTESTVHIDKNSPSYLTDIAYKLRPSAINMHKSGFFLLANPIDALVARVGLIRKAQHTLDIQYYIYKNDVTGKILANELLIAADRGVRVRLLLDDFGSYGNDDELFALDSHPNINIRLFNTFSRDKPMFSQLLGGFGTKTRRMHNKALIADNQFSIIGGRNIGDEYFGANPDIVFDDLDVLLTNPVTNDLSSIFDEFWNSRKARDVAEKISKQINKEELQALRSQLESTLRSHQESEFSTAIGNSHLVNVNGLLNIKFAWAKSNLKADNVQKIKAERDDFELMLGPQLAPLADGLTKQLIMVTPYFVPGEEGVTFFSSLRARNIEVTIVTNSLASTDVKLVHSAYAKYRHELLSIGVKLYEVDGQINDKEKRNSLSDWFASRSSLHAKYFIFDDTATFIGSFNFDPRSYFENTEVGVAIYSQQLSQQLATELLTSLPSNAFEVTLDERGKMQWQLGNELYSAEPRTSFFQRAMNTVMGWLPIESEL